jgi:hypothetical protein
MEDTAIDWFDDGPRWMAEIFDDEWGRPMELRRFTDTGNLYWACVAWKDSPLRVGGEIAAGFEQGLGLTPWQPGDPLIACDRWNRKHDH